MTGKKSFKISKIDVSELAKTCRKRLRKSDENREVKPKDVTFAKPRELRWKSLEEPKTDRSSMMIAEQAGNVSFRSFCKVFIMSNNAQESLTSKLSDRQKERLNSRKDVNWRFAGVHC